MMSTSAMDTGEPLKFTETMIDSVLTDSSPADYELPRDHPWPTDFLTGEEAAKEDAWKRVWRDDEMFEELGCTDVTTLLKLQGACHYFEGADDGYTVSGGCGHLSKGREFHFLCRTCQLLTTRDICCVKNSKTDGATKSTPRSEKSKSEDKKGKICLVGRMVKEANPREFEQVRKRRKNFINGVKDRGWPAKMMWYGTDTRLRHTALGRIAYAVGGGATRLEGWMMYLQSCAAELEIDNATEKIAQWKELGRREGPAYVFRRTQCKITPVFAKSNAQYLKYLKEKGGVAVSLIERPASVDVQTRTPSERRKPPKGFYKDNSDGSSVVSDIRKRQHGAGGSEPEVRSKMARSLISADSVKFHGSRTPTPVNLTKSELNVVEGTLMMRVPVSDSETYWNRTSAPRLQLQSNSELVEEMLDRMSTSATDPAVAALAKSGKMAVHSAVKRAMTRGDVRRQEELEQAVGIPSTASWMLKTSSAYCFDEPLNKFRVAPTQFPVRHAAGTPDRVDHDSFLPTTHRALCSMEELGRVGILNASLFMHVINDAERSATTATPEVTAAFSRIRAAARRLTDNMVDVQQTAVYHRRWSLLQGAEEEVKLRLLKDDSGYDRNVILDVRKPEKPIEETSAKTEATESGRALPKA